MTLKYTHTHTHTHTHTDRPTDRHIPTFIYSLLRINVSVSLQSLSLSLSLSLCMYICMYVYAIYVSHFPNQSFCTYERSVAARTMETMICVRGCMLYLFRHVFLHVFPMYSQPPLTHGDQDSPEIPSIPRYRGPQQLPSIAVVVGVSSSVSRWLVADHPQ